METNIQLSPQQRTFVDFVRIGSGSGILEAVAGAGKTSTILSAVQSSRGQNAIVVYNKDVALEIQEKIDKLGIDWKKCQVGTVHSFGFKAFRKAFPNVQVLGRDENKTLLILEKAIKDGKINPVEGEDEKHKVVDIRAFNGIIANLVSLAKQRAIGIIDLIDNFDAWMDIVQHFDLLADDEFGQAERNILRIINVSMYLLRASNAMTDLIDFDDMCYLPLVHKVKFWQFPNVFVDEAQDTNPARRAMVRALVYKGGRVFAVGDRHQAIYAFTGADNDSLDRIAEDFNAQYFPLTTTFRCPKKVVEFSKQWVNHIEAHETAPEGVISQSTWNQFINRNDLDSDSAVLCRTTKPLVQAAFALIRARIGCRIEGREIGQGLEKLATRWTRIKTVNALEKQLEQHLDEQRTKLLAKKKGQQLQNLEDQVETLLVIIDKCREEKHDRVDDVVSHIRKLFNEKTNGVIVLSTIHKAKGREWFHVYWLDRLNTCPSKWARQQWEHDQEKNLQYVAATRAKNELTDLQPSPDWVRRKSKPHDNRSYDADDLDQEEGGEGF